jgi:RNA polymerase primary sigma factor
MISATTPARTRMRSRAAPAAAGGARATPLLRLARRAPLLSREQELELARRIEQGDERARERMIESNLGLVVAMARSQRCREIPLCDLVQEGCVGLIQAVERFDHRRELRFSTYAVWWIRRAIADAISQAQTIRVPAKAKRQLAAVRRAEEELARVGVASDAAVGRRAGVAPGTVTSLRCAGRVTASLDVQIGDRGTSLRELIVDSTAVDPVERAIARERRREVAYLVRHLPARHREVVVRHFGLGDGEPQSHQQIGASIGVGEERSRQIEREALRRLRCLAA